MHIKYLRSRFALAGALATLVLSSCATAPTLAELYEQERYDEVLTRARADAGDADALFHLGKAYHLGKGVAADATIATGYYEQARSKGSAKASNNLGLMALERGDRKRAIALFEEALARGLELPTLSNLGRAHSPGDATSIFDVARPIRDGGIAGDYHARAYALSASPVHLLDAAREYLRAYLVARQVPGRIHGVELDTPALRARALEWLQKGMDADIPEAWTNHGALLLAEGDYAAARPSLERGAARDVAVAHFHLGMMARDGKGADAPDRERALTHLERAVQLGLDAARRPAYSLLHDLLEHESDIERLEAGMRRRAAVAPAGARPSMLRGSLEDRVAWGRYLAAHKAQARALPALPIVLRACGLGFAQPHGEAYNIGENSEWRLAAYDKLGEPRRLALSGRVDAGGCVRADGAALEALRAPLAAGAIAALRFPNYDLPLHWVREGDRVVLDLLPIGTPLPVN